MPISVSSTPDILKRYIDIKKLEGEIVGYALQINVENDDTLTRSIDKLINAVRSAVYSAKAIKDISADLERFHVTGAHQFNDPLVRLRDSSISIYSDVYKLLHDAEQTDIIEEQISDMVDAAQRSYTEFSDSFYHHFSKASFDTADTSSLLNINKEIHTSQKALLKSLKRLQSSIDIRQIALPAKQ
jgi:phosphate:Na+ symporter